MSLRAFQIYMNLDGQRWCSGIAIENSDYLLGLSLGGGAGRTKSRHPVLSEMSPGHMCLNTRPPAGGAASGRCGTFPT